MKKKLNLKINVEILVYIPEYVDAFYYKGE